MDCPPSVGADACLAGGPGSLGGTTHLLASRLHFSPCLSRGLETFCNIEERSGAPPHPCSSLAKGAGPLNGDSWKLAGLPSDCFPLPGPCGPPTKQRGRASSLPMSFFSGWGGRCVCVSGRGRIFVLQHQWGAGGGGHEAERGGPGGGGRCSWASRVPLVACL